MVSNSPRLSAERADYLEKFRIFQHDFAQPEYTLIGGPDSSLPVIPEAFFRAAIELWGRGRCFRCPLSGRFVQARRLEAKRPAPAPASPLNQ